MRSIWKGSISFGMVNIPVKLYAATAEHDLTPHQVHSTDHGRIRYVKTCSDCGEVAESIDKLYEYGDKSVILTDEDLLSIAEANNRTIEVLEFIPGEIDLVMVDKSYYLSPDKSLKAYTLLARVLKDRVAIVRFSLRSKTHLAALKVTGKNNALVVHTLRWPDEVREPAFPELDEPAEVSAAELSMAETLVKSMTSETFNTDKYRDTYREELRNLIESKIDERAGEAEVSDLLAKLKASTKAKPDIRTWARAQGLKVSDRGRIPKDIVDRYEMAV